MSKNFDHTHISHLQQTYNDTIFQKIKQNSSNNKCIQFDKVSHKEYISCTKICFQNTDVLQEQYQCQIADSGCRIEKKFDRFNFFHFLFCTCQGHILIFMPISIIFMILILKFISATVEEYISGGITYISDQLKISEAMAACTLIALSNGAGDVITAIVASGSQGGISYNIGSLYGSGFFVCAMIICLTIMSSTEEIILSKITVFRDIGFYILSVLVTIIFALQGYIYWWSALIFLLIYVAYVITVYILDNTDSQNKTKEVQNGKSPDESERSTEKKDESERTFNFQSSKSLVYKEKQEIPQKSEKKQKKQKDLKTMINQKVILKIRFSSSKRNRKQLLKQAADEQEKQKVDEEQQEKQWVEMNFLEKVIYVFELPFDWIRKITIPTSELDKFDPYLLMIQSFVCVFFCLWGFQILNTNILYLGFFISFIFSAFIYYTTKDLPAKEVPNYFIILSILGTCIGLLWSFIACQMLIDLLNTYILIFNLDETFMGLTILGIGNALPDALTTIALAKKGYAQMGITGSYAGQLFGLLVGFGIAQLKQTITYGPQKFSLFDDSEKNMLCILVIGFTLINLIATAIYAIVRDYRFNQSLAFMLGIIYSIFFIIALMIQIKELI